ncbi:MAG: hypothetical protein EOM10_17995, partial [Opitutae bacterium]|nr:hypothetical protein [Opitutae bacterium]
MNIAAGGASRTVKLQRYVGGTWTDLTTWSGIGTTGATFTHDLNSSDAGIQIRLSAPSSAIYVHDIAVTDYAAGPSAPAVATAAASGIGTTAATANGDVTDDGGDAVTERGVVYKTSSGVAITDNPTAAAAGGEGEYGVDLSSLDVNQIYYFKAYAINGVDTTLAANELNFTTLANVPAAPTVDNPTATTLDVAVNANGNPAATEFA